MFIDTFSFDLGEGRPVDYTSIGRTLASSRRHDLEEIRARHRG
jgi:hypothetical protein